MQTSSTGNAYTSWWVRAHALSPLFKQHNSGSSSGRSNSPMRRQTYQGGNWTACDCDVDDKLFNQILRGTSTTHRMVMQNEIAGKIEDIPKGFGFTEADSVEGHKDKDAKIRTLNIKRLVQGQAGMYPKKRIKG